MAYRIMIKTGNAAPSVSPYRFITEVEEHETKILTFDTKKDVKDWIYNAINKGDFRKPDILIIETAQFGIDIKFGDDNDNIIPEPDVESPTLDTDSASSEWIISICKLGENGTHIPNDINYAESAANQIAFNLNKLDDENYEIDVTGTLQQFISTSPVYKDPASWIGLIVNCNKDIKKIKVGGFDLTDDDVADSVSVGVPIEENSVKSFILWVNKENLENSDKILSLECDGVEKNITIKLT